MIRHCSNDECPDYLSTGIRQEFSDTMSSCSSCGANLVDGEVAIEPELNWLEQSRRRKMREPPAMRLTPTRGLFPFFPVATDKLIVLSICTFGIYELYWAYKNWQRIQAASGETLSPFWRALFAPLWSFSLFGRIRDRVTQGGTPADWPPPFLAICYLLLTALWRLPDPWWLISFASFLPLIPVQQATQRFNEQHNASEDLNSDYTGKDVAVIILGGSFFIFAVVGSFLPE